MAEIQDLVVADGSNTGRWPENMQFSAVNNAGRADEGLMARWYKDLDGSVTASGVSNAFTATSNRTIAALFNNLQMCITANHTISGAATLNLNGLGAKSIKRFNGDALASADITSGQPFTVIYKSSPDIWYMMTAAASLATGAGSFDFTENASPGTPAADVGRMYASDQAGLTAPAWIDSAATARTIITSATVAEMEAGTNTVRGATVSAQKYHPAHPKAWLNWRTDTAAIASDFGVSSTTDNGTGFTTVTWDSNFSSTAYAVAGAADEFGTDGNNSCEIESLSTSSAGIVTHYATSGGGRRDMVLACLVALGDLA